EPTLSRYKKNLKKFHLVSYPNYICNGNSAFIKTHTIMAKSVFYHAGCPVCVSAEHDIVELMGAENVEIVHIGEVRNRIEEAEKPGVPSVPALVTPNGNVLHNNFGATVADVKG